jgi:hypothetical protein
LVQAQASRVVVAVGETGGQVRLAGRDWAWAQIVAPTDDPRSLQIAVRVSTAEGGLAAEAFAFLPAPEAAP